MSEDEKYLFEVLVNAIKRFESEGFSSWSKDDLLALLNAKLEVVESDYFQGGLAGLKAAGVVDVIGSDEVYLRVLRPSP